MKNTKFEDGGEIDEMEAANKGEDLAAEQRGENILKAMRDAEAKPKVKPKRPAKKITRDADGKPSNAGPDVLGSNYSRNTRSGATAKMMQPRYPSKESVMERRTQYKKAQDESAPSTFKKGGSIDGIAQRGKTRGKMC